MKETRKIKEKSLKLTTLGFTLIELLAVILIIGVIASIAVISVDKTLKNSKNSLSKVQIKTIEEAAEAYYIKEGMQEDVSCVNVVDLIDKGYIESNEVIDPKTKKHMEGSVEIRYEANQYSYKYSEDTCKQFIVAATEETKTLAGKVPQGNLELGDEYIVNVDGIHSYHFYVLSIEGDKVNLIMSRNICSDGTLATTYVCNVKWDSSPKSDSHGPITAMNYLHETTKNWNNVENIQMNYTDEGNKYGMIKTNGNITTITMKDGTATATYTNLKARMPKISEITETECKIYSSGSGSGSCPIWMVNGLSPSTSNYPTGTKEDISGISGYWSLSGYTHNIAFALDSKGYAISRICDDGGFGIRPVITVSVMDIPKNQIIISQNGESMLPKSQE